MYSPFNTVFNGISQTPQEELRGSRSALPMDVVYYLNEVQRIALNSLETFGWQLSFIRRPLFVAPMIVVKNDDRTKYAVLEDDGTLNLTPQLKLRH